MGLFDPRCNFMQGFHRQFIKNHRSRYLIIDYNTNDEISIETLTSSICRFLRINCKNTLYFMLYGRFLGQVPSSPLIMMYFGYGLRQLVLFVIVAAVAC
jgi:hypothetical protein